MIPIRSRLIFGIVRKTISMVLTVAYKILSLFNLQPAMLVGAIGLVLYFTGTLKNNGSIAVIFYLVLTFSIVYAIFATVKKLLGFTEKKPKKRSVQIVKTVNEVETVKEQTVENESIPNNTDHYEKTTVEQTVESQPRYFRVKGRPNYVMAEFSDRYELYKISNGKLIKIRTDNK